MKLIIFLTFFTFAGSINASNTGTAKFDLPMMVFLSATTCKNTTLTTKEIAGLAKLMNIQSVFTSGEKPPHYEGLVQSASQKSLVMIKNGGEKKYCEYISDIHKIVNRSHLLENLLIGTFDICTWMTTQKLSQIKTTKLGYDNLNTADISEITTTLKIQNLMQKKYGKPTYCEFMRITYDAVY